MLFNSAWCFLKILNPRDYIRLAYIPYIGVVDLGSMGNGAMIYPSWTESPTFDAFRPSTGRSEGVNDRWFGLQELYRSQKTPGSRCVGWNDIDTLTPFKPSPQGFEREMRLDSRSK